ncbi:hypothetical protein ACFE04_012707 [Oxalis oulophora]
MEEKKIIVGRLIAQSIYLAKNYGKWTMGPHSHLISYLTKLDKVPIMTSSIKQMPLSLNDKIIEKYKDSILPPPPEDEGVPKVGFTGIGFGASYYGLKPIVNETMEKGKLKTATLNDLRLGNIDRKI